MKRLRYYANCIYIHCTFLALNAGAQVRNPFLTLKCDSVVMYDYEQGREEGEIVYNGKIDGHVKKRIMLDKITTNSINKMIGKSSSYNSVVAGCFDPHLGIVYYQAGKIVGHISVCLHCSGLHSMPEIKNRKPAISNSLRQFFNKLVVKYHFSNGLSN